jgi:peptidyl-prolyl cis-trans isomerase C
MKKFVMAAVAASCVCLGYVPMTFALAEAPQQAEPVSDVVARVGDQAITFQEITTALNSSAIVGVSVPALGTPERDTVRLTLLDRFISANLLYLDARKQGLDKDPAYLREVERFDAAVLAGLYQQHQLGREVTVSEEDIQDYSKKNLEEGAELTADQRIAIEAQLRSEKLKQQQAYERSHIRDGVDVVVREEQLAVSGDAGRADSVVIAEINGNPVAWGDVKQRIIAAGKGAVIADPLANEENARKRVLRNEIDLRILADKARAAGLDREPIFTARSGEYHKTRLINLHRDRLIAQMMPTDTELKTFYEKNQAAILVPEARKVQIVVLKTREDADQVRNKIISGGLTMYQAAQQYSTAENAKDNLGEMGWVNKGEAVPKLDAVIFALGPGEVSEPVETPTGWHLITVQDQREAKYDNFNEAATRKLVQHKYLDQKLDDYVVNLRMNDFTVTVYQDVLVRLAQQESDMVKSLAEKAEQPGSETEQRIGELRKLIKP